MSTIKDSKVSKDQSQAIFNNYRAALRGQREQNHRNRESRAGNRKQVALQLTADRYHVKISEVKEIVREFEEAAGIKHEQDPNYVLRRAYEKARFAEADLREAEHLEMHGEGAPYVCDHCGTDDPEQLIRLRFNPESNFSDPSTWRFDVSCFTCWRELGGSWNWELT